MTREEMFKAVVGRVLDLTEESTFWIGGASILRDYKGTPELVSEHDYLEVPLAVILFDHTFAKAFWGEKREIEKYAWYVEGHLEAELTLEQYEKALEEQCYWDRYEPIYRHMGWQYHLQQAVISEDPLLYYFERL